MSATAILAERLGKRYDVGEAPSRHALLSDRIGGWARQAVRRARGHEDVENRTVRGRREAFWALRNLSFEIHHGEAIGIIGRNGAGKSTLLRILSRITKPTEGRATLFGRVGSLLEVGTGFHPELTGRDNVYLSGAILGMRRSDIIRKFDEIVAFAEVEKFIDTPVKHYSSGMGVRLAFAVAAHLEPEILLVDEVLAVGDTAFQRKCLGKMDGVTREGRTVLLVSHDLTSIQVLCQRALRLGRGEVAGLGPVEQEIRAYLSESRSIAGVELDHPVSINDSVDLVRFGCAPSPVPSGDPADCQIAIEATRETRIDELAVLVQDGLNRRVAIIDFRVVDGPHRVGPGHPLALTAHLTSVPLVEGEYRLGLSIRTDEGHTVKHDIATMEVVSRSNQEIVPHSASMRGVASFDYTIDRS